MGDGDGCGMFLLLFVLLIISIGGCCEENLDRKRAVALGWGEYVVDSKTGKTVFMYYAAPGYPKESK